MSLKCFYVINEERKKERRKKQTEEDTIDLDVLSLVAAHQSVLATYGELIPS